MNRALPGRRAVAFVVVVAVASLGLLSLPAAAITQANEITYVYDGLGRLQAVVDPAATNGVARTPTTAWVSRIKYLGHFLPEIGWVQPPAR